MTPVLSALVVDDQPAFRRAAAAVLAMTSSSDATVSDVEWKVQIVAEAEDLRSALAAATKCLALDVAIVDLHLGHEDGIEVCRQLRALRPELAVILVSTAAPEDLPMDAQTCGAIAFISKSRFMPAAVADVLDTVANLR